MQSVIINGVTYNNVPTVNIPLASGKGTATYTDTSDSTVTADKLYSGTTAYGADGQKVTGTMTAATVSQDSTTKVLTIA